MFTQFIVRQVRLEQEAALRGSSHNSQVFRIYLCHRTFLVLGFDDGLRLRLNLSSEDGEELLQVNGGLEHKAQLELGP